MSEPLIAEFPELPEGYWWKKELSGNYRGIRDAPTSNSMDGECIIAIHHESDGFALAGDDLLSWGVYESISDRRLGNNLTAQEAVNFAYALFILGEQDDK